LRTTIAPAYESFCANGFNEDLTTAWCRERPRSDTVLLPESFGKSAALQSAWNVSAGAELTAVYDADVSPASGALRMLAEEFADLRVGAAAGAVVPSIAHTNFISRYAALELYVFHHVIKTARHRLRLNPPTVGANCVYRTSALAEMEDFPKMR
jgi:cellulose synthase/poly-beta-1,6-N-acetylglucosamine synthase-like glycosyltransferase